MVQNIQMQCSLTKSAFWVGSESTKTGQIFPACGTVINNIASKDLVLDCMATLPTWLLCMSHILVKVLKK